MDLYVKPSEEELNDLAKALDRVWHLDANRLVPGVHYTLDLQEGKTTREAGFIFSKLQQNIDNLNRQINFHNFFFLFCWHQRT